MQMRQSLLHTEKHYSNINELQILTNHTDEWFGGWRLKPNPTKSQFVIYNHNITPTSPTITIRGITKKPNTSMKYQGIHIDSKLNLNLHTKLIKRKVISRAKYFRQLTMAS
ncbi:hypothetical protein HHI36_016046 [Cryptolaemus montrouzieri]|uniref:Uncharacterized protein n=1 Tax=Cryptolaemus montrouzieri TaxID=559131 RepID=A0ABD2N783_9CUCU